MKVKDLMTENISICRTEAQLTEAAENMQLNDCGIVPVIDVNERLVGVITDRDICLALAVETTNLTNAEVGKFMTSNVICCSANDKIEKALKKMRANQIKRLVVTGKNGELVGILSITDILNSVRKNKKLKKNIYKTLEAIFQPRPIVLREFSD